MVSVGSLLVVLVAAAVAVTQVLNVTGSDNGGFYYSFQSADGSNVTVLGYEGFDDMP